MRIGGIPTGQATLSQTLHSEQVGRSAAAAAWRHGEVTARQRVRESSWPSGVADRGSVRSALFAERCAAESTVALVAILRWILSERMALGHQQAAGSFRHRVIKRGNQATHHRAAVNKTGVVGPLRRPRQRQHFMQ